MAQNANNPQAGAGRPLPKKEADAFRNVIKMYESKQYKKAIKHADAILKKFPNHGETLAMKGLTLNYMNKKEEAHEFVKQGLMFDMRSHVCWHVYGLLHRADRNYNEAIKAYKQALKIDPENFQILRDLSLLQIQMRDLEGFVVTRNTIMALKPNMKTNWLAFALARHMTGDLEGAKSVIDTYLGTLNEDHSEFSKGFESSELALYNNTLLAELPDNYQAALDHLHSIEKVVVDKGAWLTRKAEYQLMIGDYNQAKLTTLALFDRGQTESYRVHTLFMCSLLALERSVIVEALALKGARTLPHLLPLSGVQKSSIKKAYTEDLALRYPKSFAVKRIPTFILQGDELKSELRDRCRVGISKGIPSLCSELLSYVLVESGDRFVSPSDPLDYKEHPVQKMLVEIVDDFILNLQSNRKFVSTDESEEPPSSLLWAMYLRAALFEVVGDYKAGIELVDKCIEHTPTAVDMYELKALLLLQAGDVKGAAECADQGRNLDGQDRYINNLTTRYMLQADMEVEALDRISMFTKHEGNPEKNLYDMQCSWYELEVADSLARQKKWGMSLKKYVSVARHFDDFNEDQFDFHSYCWRKVTLRAYISVIRYEDEIYGHEYFCRAAAGAIKIYLHLHDKPESDDDAEPDFSKMSAAEKKKAKAIARKKKKQTEKKETEAKEKLATNDKPSSGKSSFLDEDPLGEELAKKDPLEESKKFSDMLVQYAPMNIESWILRYDVAMRRRKPLMALQALYKAKAIDAKNDQLFIRLCDFATKLDSWKECTELVRSIIEGEGPLLLDGQPLSSFVKAGVQTIESDQSCSLLYRVAVAKSLVTTKTGSVVEATKLIKEGLLSRGVSTATCKSALNALKSFGPEASKDVETFKAAIKERFPLSTVW